MKKVLYISRNAPKNGQEGVSFFFLDTSILLLSEMPALALVKRVLREKGCEAVYFGEDWKHYFWLIDVLVKNKIPFQVVSSSLKVELDNFLSFL